MKSEFIILIWNNYLKSVRVLKQLKWDLVWKWCLLCNSLVIFIIVIQKETIWTVILAKFHIRYTLKRCCSLMIFLSYAINRGTNNPSITSTIIARHKPVCKFFSLQYGVASLERPSTRSPTDFYDESTPIRLVTVNCGLIENPTCHCTVPGDITPRFQCSAGWFSRHY